jgi:CRISPR/Cas system-associated exonuclease Cas4 (RecB family)
MKLTSIKDLQNADNETIQKYMRHVQVIPKIEAHLEDMNLAPSKRKLGVFSASEIGSRGGLSLCGKYKMGCSRMLYHRYIGDTPKEDISPRIRSIFDTGSQIHIQLQNYLHNFSKSEALSGIEFFWDEVKIEPDAPGVSDIVRELDIVSTADGIYAIKTANEQIRFGVEIKSMKAEMFKELTKAHSENIVQAHVYMGCLDLPAMTILYYNKNDSTMAEFCVLFKQEIWDAIVKKIRFVISYAIDEVPPPREIGFHCKNCKYNYLCKPPKNTKKGLQLTRQKFRL